MRQDQVIIIGAGPAGLTAAYELTKQGFRPTVLEGSDQVGGLSRTVNYKGYRFDIGGHRFFSKAPVINELWHEILGGEFLLRPRMSRIYYDRHFFDYPLKALNALSGLGPVEALRVCWSYLESKVSPIRPEASLEQWVTNRFGKRLYEIFFKTYTEKVWGMPCSDISADWAAQRIKNLSLLEALRNALLGVSRSRSGGTITSLIEQFHYPRYGPGMMWEYCERLVRVGGGQVVRGTWVESIRHTDGRIDAVVARTVQGERVEYEGASIISTMPLRDLIRAMDPAPPFEVQRAAERLRYRDYLTVVLLVNREVVFPDNWIYVHSPEVKMGRIQNYKNWSPFMVPDASKTSLGLEYFLWEKDDEWRWSQDQLVDLGVRECARLGLIDPREVEDGTVVRAEKAYPVYDQNYQANVETVRRYLSAFANLQTIGRNGLHRYNNQDHSMLTGLYAARNLVGERHDVWTVNTEMAYHEEHEPNFGVLGERRVPARVVVPVPSAPISGDEVLVVAFARLDTVALGVAIGVVSGLGLWVASLRTLLMPAASDVRESLALLGNFLPGFEVSWAGAVTGALELGVLGFAVGWMAAGVRNGSLRLYARWVRRHADAEEVRDILSRV